MNQETDDNITPFPGAELPDIPAGLNAPDASAQPGDAILRPKSSNATLLWIALFAGLLVVALVALTYFGVINAKLPFLPQGVQPTNESLAAEPKDNFAPPLPQQTVSVPVVEPVLAPSDFPINRQSMDFATPVETSSQPKSQPKNDVWLPANTLSEPLTQPQAPATVPPVAQPTEVNTATTPDYQTELVQLKNTIARLEVRVDVLTLNIQNLESQLAQTQNTQKTTARSKPVAPTRSAQPIAATSKPSVPSPQKPKKPKPTQNQNSAADSLTRLKLVSAKQIGSRVIVKFKANGRTVRLSIGDRYNGWTFARIDLRRGEALFTKGSTQKVIQL